VMMLVAIRLLRRVNIREFRTEGSQAVQAVIENGVD
jgi:hypothetical protein